MEAHANYDGELIPAEAKGYGRPGEKIERRGFWTRRHSRIVPQEEVWRLFPNHADARSTGFDAWAENFLQSDGCHQVCRSLTTRWQGAGATSCQVRQQVESRLLHYDHLREPDRNVTISYGISDDAALLRLRDGASSELGRIADQDRRYRSRITTRRNSSTSTDLHGRAIRSVKIGYAAISTPGGWLRRARRTPQADLLR